MVQWVRFHASTAGGAGLIPGQGTKITAKNKTKQKTSLDKVLEFYKKNKARTFLRREGCEFS